MKNFLYLQQFLSAEEEQQLIDEIYQYCDADGWQQVNKRRIKHFGLEYDYPTFSVIRDQVPPFPHFMEKLLNDKIYPALDNYFSKNSMAPGDIDDRLPEGYHLYPVSSRQYFNQITVQEYQPKAGIPAHVDICDYFGDFILTLTLQSHTVMHFEEAPWPPEPPVPMKKNLNKALYDNFIKHKHSDIDGNDNQSAAVKENVMSVVTGKTGRKVKSQSKQNRFPTYEGMINMLLDRGSLGVMYGDSRYLYKHSIRDRSTDLLSSCENYTVPAVSNSSEGDDIREDEEKEEIKKRGVRISLTFRHVKLSYHGQVQREPVIHYNKFDGCDIHGK